MITSSHEGCWGQVIFCSCVEISTHSDSRCLPRLAVSHGGGKLIELRSPRHGVSRRHCADQINVQVSRACRQASVQSAPRVSPRQPEPFLTCGLDTAEPHIRSPLIAAGTKIPHTRGHRVRKSGTHLYHGILQPGRYAVRSPRSGKGQLPSRMAGFSFDVARWIRPLSTQPPPALLPVSRSARARLAVCGQARQS